jgi:sodium/potassium-transporting ATPase subunit alpha
LDCSETQGLTNDQAQRRLQENGKNILSPPPTRLFQKMHVADFFHILINSLVYFFGGFGGMLAIAAIVCIICYKPLGLPNPDSSNLALGILLFVVISIQGIFNAWQDWVYYILFFRDLTAQSSTRIMASITGMIPVEALVLREGQQKRVPAAELVVGDIIYVTLGNKCPADFRILECSGDLKFDRSVLTGESIPISGTTKQTDPNFMETRNIGMQGTHVINGNCVGLVIQTGDLTVFGRIAKLSSSERSEWTTLQKVCTSFSKRLC